MVLREFSASVIRDTSALSKGSSTPQAVQREMSDNIRNRRSFLSKLRSDGMNSTSTIDSDFSNDKKGQSFKPFVEKLHNLSNIIAEYNSKKSKLRASMHLDLGQVRALVDSAIHSDQKSAEIIGM